MMNLARSDEHVNGRHTALRTSEWSEVTPLDAVPSPVWEARSVTSRRAPDSARAEALAGPRSDSRTTASSVLVVDDSLKVRLDLRAALHAAGFTVTACDSRASAMKAIQSRTFNLVILDVILQDGTGIEILRALRSRQETADVPVILLASGSSMRERLRGLDLGVDEVLLKPFVAAELVRCALRMARFSSPPEPPSSERVPRSTRSAAPNEAHRAPDVSPLCASAVWRNQDEVPVGSLLYRAAVQSGLAAVLGPVHARAHASARAWRSSRRRPWCSPSRSLPSATRSACSCPATTSSTSSASSP